MGDSCLGEREKNVQGRKKTKQTNKQTKKDVPLNEGYCQNSVKLGRMKTKI